MSLDLDAIERMIIQLDTDEYNQGVPKNAPWRAFPSRSGSDRWVIYQPTGSDRSRIITEGVRQPFADFIAHARSDVPALAAAVERVRELHRQGDSPAAKRFGGCLHCREPWPCPTIRALGGAS